MHKSWVKTMTYIEQLKISTINHNGSSNFCFSLLITKKLEAIRIQIFVGSFDYTYILYEQDKYTQYAFWIRFLNLDALMYTYVIIQYPEQLLED